jgi:hypothetical protein
MLVVEACRGQQGLDGSGERRWRGSFLSSLHSSFLFLLLLLTLETEVQQGGEDGETIWKRKQTGVVATTERLGGVCLTIRQRGLCGGSLGPFLSFFPLSFLPFSSSFFPLLILFFQVGRRDSRSGWHGGEHGHAAVVAAGKHLWTA